MATEATVPPGLDTENITAAVFLMVAGNARVAATDEEFLQRDPKMPKPERGDEGRLTRRSPPLV